VSLAYVSSADAPVEGRTPSGSFVAVLLHGYGSDERDLAGLASYLPRGVPWVSVRAPLRHPAFGHAWYPITVPGEPAVEAIAAATNALWGWIDAALPPDSMVVPIGFSQGGLMATQLLRTRPERIPAAAVLSGYVQDEPQAADALLEQSRPPVFWGRGTQDAVIPAAAVELAAEWLPRHASLEERVYPGMGHSVCEDELVHLRRFVSAIRAGEPQGA